MTTLTFISDTHNLHGSIPTSQLPGGDFLCHTGDFTGNGNITQCNQFFEWFESQTQYVHRIFIAGNHEMLAEQRPNLFKSIIPSNCIYLNDSGIFLEDLYFYGTPVTANFCNWAFNKDTTKLNKHFAMIPDKTNVLLTHGGPLNSSLQVLRPGLDLGMEELSDRIIDLPNLKVSAFGHVHAGFGHEELNGVHFINSAICGENYRVANKPITIKLD